MASYYKYIDPRDLAAKLSDETIAIVDVRDEDFDDDGYIPHAINLPSEKWDEDDLVDQLIASHQGKSCVVFHCRMSQVRGPSCATRYIERRAEILGEEQGLPEVYTNVIYFRSHEICRMVLAGGFRRWKQMFAGTEGMIATNKS